MELVAHDPLLVRYRGLDVVVRARTRIGERHYNVVLKNCEHFATWFVCESSTREVCVNES